MMITKPKKTDEQIRIQKNEVSNDHLQIIGKILASNNLQNKVLTDKDYLLVFLNMYELLKDKDCKLKDIKIRTSHINIRKFDKIISQFVSVGWIVRILTKERIGFNYHIYGINDQYKQKLEELQQDALSKFNKMVKTGEIYNL